MYCKRCGSQITDGTRYCPHCGAMQDGAQNPYQSQPYNQPPSTYDSGSAGWGVLGFFFPIVGLILFLVWRQDKPKSAKSAGLGALINVILDVVCGVIIFIIAVIAVSVADVPSVYYAITSLLNCIL